MNVLFSFNVCFIALQPATFWSYLMNMWMNMWRHRTFAAVWIPKQFYRAALQDPLSGSYPEALLLVPSFLCEYLMMAACMLIGLL